MPVDKVIDGPCPVGNVKIPYACVPEQQALHLGLIHNTSQRGGENSHGFMGKSGAGRNSVDFETSGTGMV